MDEVAATVLEARVADLCGHVNVLHAQLVDAVVEALEGGLWEQWGVRTPEHWLAWQTGLSPSHARQLVEVARRKVELPVTFAAFADGELSVDQVATVVKHTPGHNDAEVCELAKTATVAQLRHVLSTYVHDLDPPTDVVEIDVDGGGDPRDRVSMSYGEPGRYRLQVDAPAHHGAIIDSAIREARDALFLAGQGDVTWLDALVEVCQRSIGAIGSVSRRDRFRIYWHLNTPDDPDGPAEAWLNAGPALPAALRDVLMCDGIVRPLWHTAGQPINVGRSVYIVPEHTRRVVLDRDRTCRYPGCNATTHLEVHHLRPFTAGGTTDTWNLAALCPRDHDRHHRGEFTITGNADTPGDLTFHDHHRRRIPEAGIPNPPTGPPPAPPPGKHYQHPTGEQHNPRWFQLTDPPLLPVDEALAHA